MGSVRWATAEESPSSSHRDQSPLAVLISGGLDSAILLGEALQEHTVVQPLYVRSGLLWEAVELEHLERFLRAVACPALRPLHILELPVSDLYGRHWSITGRNVPDGESADEAVFLPGRNVLLLVKALLWCHRHEVATLALGLLKGNPFPDASPAFFTAFAHVVHQAVGGRVRIDRPYALRSKAEIMRRGRGLPLGLTFSCICPVAGRHCGRCNKCAERRRAFATAGMADATAYDAEKPCTA